MLLFILLHSYCYFYHLLSISESLLCKIFLEGEDLKHATRKDNHCLDNRDDNDLIVDFNIRLSKFIFRFAIHLLIFDELFSSSLHDIDFLL